MNLLAAGASLPRLTFDRLGAPGQVTWSQGPLASVVFVPHPGGCAGCGQYLAELTAAAPGLGEWASRILVLAGEGWSSPEPVGVAVLDDADGKGRSQIGLGAADAAVLQADRWGAVYQAEVVRPDGDHGVLPRAGELIGMAKYIDIQCPECGVPSREWLGATPFPLG